MSDKQACSHGKYGETGSFSLPTKQTSMCSLIIWNISKAVEKNPSIDLTRAIHLASERLDSESRDESRVISQTPGDRHITCALLAWHQLGHSDIDGLCKFIENNRNKLARNTSDTTSNSLNTKRSKPEVSTGTNKTDHKIWKNMKEVDSSVFDTSSLMGPVVKLPETIVMRYEPPPPCQHHLKKPQKVQTCRVGNVKDKIDAACCMDSACVQRLTDLDKAVTELRRRATKVARQEAERVAVLERAEAAWIDLELGYQRRLALALEKEDDLDKQIKNTIEERNTYKMICTSLAETLKERGEAAEKERDRLRSLEKEVCERACARLRLSEESAKGDAELAEQLCRASQLDRDLQFKEEQARRKVSNTKSELESCQCLCYEAERAMRLELSMLKDQMNKVSKKLLAEEDNKNSIKRELEDYRQEKANIIEDLDGCKDMCDNRMKAQVDELNQKREQLDELKKKVMECRCKEPLDVAVEVKRTASLAALCRCAPEDKFLDTCSCTSIRSQLLSNLLADLFGGLQAELSSSGVLMPCALLLCIDDRHNWDRSSAVKSNLRNFFAQLLVGELDIAIATSIEKYHARWVGTTCADKARLRPDPGEEDIEGWEQRAIERRAQKLAAKIAEQLFEERAEQLKQKAKEIVTSGPPPCECKTNQTAVFPCLVKAPITNTALKNSEAAPSYMKRTIQDVTQLKHQLLDLKKETIKKEDLRQMEEKLTKIIERVSKVESSPTTSRCIKCIKNNPEAMTNYDEKPKTYDRFNKNKDLINSAAIKKLDKTILKKHVKRSSNSNLGRIDKKSNNVFKKLEQSFAVNLCLCSGQEASKELTQAIQCNNNLKSSWKQKKSKDFITNVASVKQSKPISTLVIKEKNKEACKSLTKTVCPNDCLCFHKIPSNTSIDKLLDTLSKWNGNLNIKDTKEIEKYKNKSLISDVFNFKNNETENDEAVKFKDTSSTYQLSKQNKDTASKSILAYATESEYIGAINLDKSNDNICKCPKNSKTKTDDIPFHCINSDTCECKNSGLSKISQTTEFNIPSNINKISQLYLAETDKPKFKCIETDTRSLNKSNSNKKSEVSDNTYIHDLVRKSQLFPNSCDYLVKFLGVTLTNTSLPNRSKQNCNDDMLRKPVTEPINLDVDIMKDISLNIDMKENKSIDPINFKHCLDKNFNSDNDTEECKISDELLDINEDDCVCCQNRENSNDLELNAFNLLEEHIKGKLGDCLSSSCKSSCITPDEKNKLYSTILIKVKEIISESTKGFSCKSCEDGFCNENWSRAYGMLQEYLKVKIKRVQCSCISSERNVKSILEKVCDLIEYDFQRLKKKCKCNNEDKNVQNSNSISLTKDNIFRNETTIGTGNEKERTSENDEHILFQKKSCMNFDKSCDVIESIQTNVGTSEKKVSCEFKLFSTDCSCKQNIIDSSDLEKEYVVNQCRDVISNKENNFKGTLNECDVKCTISSLSKRSSQSKQDKNENIFIVDGAKSEVDLPTNIPYIGSTLSSKSFFQYNSDKIDSIWKTATNETRLSKCSYIMKKVLMNENPENEIKGNNNQTMNINDIEVNTLENGDNLVLKYNSDDCFVSKTFGEIDTCTDIDSENSSPSRKCETQQFDNFYQKDTFDKTYLYDSLHLPTATEKLRMPIESRNLVDIDDTSQLEQEKCECKMVPLCHVKMLVNDIEKKMIETKYTDL